MTCFYKSDLLNKVIKWEWSDKDKQYWLTWIPKKRDLIILTELNKEDTKTAKNELWDNLQEALNDTKELIKKKRKLNYARRKQQI
jgi:hypothetical protein